jgi:hypothetical protein
MIRRPRVIIDGAPGCHFEEQAAVDLRKLSKLASCNASTEVRGTQFHDRIGGKLASSIRSAIAACATQALAQCHRAGALHMAIWPAEGCAEIVWSAVASAKRDTALD